ncbi:TPA: (deoxy)nucleoside triphosphate pyrophosphohydrolase [Pseudomonas aeruginosa]|uniref:(deoxy)nucleoside triphosphate pyrophosphohydrolase n=1 Tax=Pseudomonas aeruginosa TaxID=287 RepID=UPI0004F31EA8|nr:(deoxy)nucleoside triphosphate pyrophosphohydrolase [Pseudomonas aeruginosa]EIU7214838.1 (deoxy)nucleoside triphosphate pyrophosphohydrolase [Pseudomonas aeruginosa]ELL1277690.1 (deoxy)nucleoside triphosphate pyrophosphohydrolase [Pseudomonas aeruginosa]MBV5608475.1 (deoxy)nucleoside triphosphate pyrophosphohydrolase [Pseudomonas aeruginosa]MCC0385058.1 (deoxy)nucleoside triphosphate pyrophosphohydrolase [Pseudomonas aeruginosa]MCK1829360.1 (deoxy)nucleoside triphosphate pyrophosphohydrolas
MVQSVAAAVIYLNDKVLITRRAPGEKLAGIWEFPGGKLEAGETPQTCIVRELREELGVESVAGEILTTSLYTYPGGAVELIAVVVSLRSTALKLQVHDLAKWIPPQELLSYDLAPADIPIAEEIIRTYG